MLSRLAFAFAIAGALQLNAASAEEFHTDPACWAGPRVYHVGPPSDELARRIETTPNVTREARDNAVVSPNGAYRFWVEIPNTPNGNQGDAILYVDSEQDRVTRFYVEQAVLPLQPRWITEKLIYMRVVWGRIVFSDVIIDAEKGEMIYEEEARDGAIAYQQFQQACGGSCPCGPADEAPVEPLPTSAPANGEAIGLLELPSVLNHDLPPSVAPPPDVPKAPVSVFLDFEGARRELTKLSKPEDFETREHGYEEQAAVVYETQPGWYRVGLGGGVRTVWVRAEDAGAYMPAESLLEGRLAYLDADWDGRVWPTLDAPSAPVRSSLKAPGGDEEYTVEVLEMRRTQNGPYWRVRLFAGSPCESMDAPAVVDEGWVPAWSAQGKLVGWFHSRGC